ncbi:MAG: hypothetical protein RR858_07845, partial [Mucinivorans sp.]
KVEVVATAPTVVVAAPKPIVEQKIVEPKIQQPIATTTEKPAATSPTVIGTPRSVLGLSINAPKVVDNQVDVSQNNTVTPAIETRTEAQIAEILTRGMAKVIELWHSRNRLRIATALSMHRIEGSRLVIIVDGESLVCELQMAKQDVERDVLDLLGVRINLEIEEAVVESVPSRPVTIEQRLQYLVDVNPELLNLREKLDLTI